MPKQCKTCHWANEGNCMMGLNNWRYTAPEETVCEWYQPETADRKADE